MNKCKTCGDTLLPMVEGNTCPDCLQEQSMTGFQDNEDPFDLDAEIEKEEAILGKYLENLGL